MVYRYILASVRIVVNYELESFWNASAYIKYYPDICIGGLRTTMYISQDGQPLDGDLNLGPAEGITT